MKYLKYSKYILIILLIVAIIIASIIILYPTAEGTERDNTKTTLKRNPLNYIYSYKSKEELNKEIETCNEELKNKRNDVKNIDNILKLVDDEIKKTKENIDGFIKKIHEFKLNLTKSPKI